MHKKFRRKTRWIAVGALGTFVAVTAAGDRLVFRAHARVVETEQIAVTRRYDIPADSVEKALEAFKQVSGVRMILARPEFGTLPSPGVRGVFAAERALQILLNGTGLDFRHTESNTITIDLQELRQTINVTAGAPGGALSSSKYTEPLRDIPQTITVIPATVIQQQGATTLRDVLKNVTGISIQAGEGGVPSGDNLSIRGFNARTDMFVDGIRDTGGGLERPGIFLYWTRLDRGLHQSCE
jgi:catecholate siderophore receptor